MHRDYGEQFKIETFEKIMPKTADGLINYLASGIIKGIGPATAKRIVKKFGEETLMVMKTEPDRLATVKGISKDRAIEICEEFVQKWDLWEIVTFLENYGIGAKNAQKVYQELGPTAIRIIESNPYVLIDIVYNVDFKQIDKMAMQMGIDTNFKARIEAGIKYALVTASNNGNSCVVKENLIQYVKELLQVESDVVENELINCRVNDIIVIDEFEDQEWVFLKSFYKVEENISKKIEKMLSEPNYKKVKEFDKYLKEKRLSKGKKTAAPVVWIDHHTAGAAFAPFYLTLSDLILSHHCCLDEVRISRTSERDTCREHDHVTFLDITFPLRCFCRVQEEDLHAVLLADMDRRHSPGHVELTACTLIRRAAHDLAARSVL